MIEPYCGAAPTPVDWLSRWNVDPALIAVLVLFASIHLLALRREPAGPRFRRFGYASVAWVLIVAMFVSPLCALTSALFSARVAHHMVLVAVAAPLLALSLPAHWRFPAHGAFGTLVFVGQAAALWFWHAPSPYAAALSDSRIFWFMELSLIFSAVLFWLFVTSPSIRLSAILGILLGTVMHMGVLGAIITFARQPLYAAHMFVTDPWGLNALQDQQLAGLIMWVPSAVPYMAVALVLLASRIAQPSVAAETVQ